MSAYWDWIHEAESFGFERDDAQSLYRELREEFDAPPGLDDLYDYAESEGLEQFTWEDAEDFSWEDVSDPIYDDYLDAGDDLELSADIAYGETT